MIFFIMRYTKFLWAGGIFQGKNYPREGLLRRNFPGKILNRRVWIPHKKLEKRTESIPHQR